MGERCPVTAVAGDRNPVGAPYTPLKHNGNASAFEALDCWFESSQGFHVALAQLVEQEFCKLQVGSSNLPRRLHDALAE